MIVLSLGLFTMACRGVTDPDVWWHLRTGQLIAHNHRVFHTDPYSFTRAGQTWVNHEWLSELFLFGVYQAAGWGGLIVIFGAVIAAAFFIVFLRCRGRPYVAGLVTVWGALASVPSWGVRPQMLTFLLASVFLFLLERSEQKPSLIWWTVPLMLLWVNLHAGYILGIGLMVLFLAGGVLDRVFGAGESSNLNSLGLTIIACLAVVPLNPNGWRMFWYPLVTLRSAAMQSYIHEWFSPDFHRPAYFPLLLMMLATMALLPASSQRVSPRQLLLMTVTMFAALVSVRHIPIFVLIAVPVLSGLVQAQFQIRGVSLQKGPLRLAVNAIVLAALVVFMGVRLREVITQQKATEARSFPAAAVAFLSKAQPPGPILNHYNWGGYFIWKLYPQYRVYIDGRADLYGDAFMEEFVATYHLRGAAWQAPLEKWGIQTVVLPPESPMVTALRASPGWKPIYSDSLAEILTRSP